MIGAFDLGTTTGWACGAAGGAMVLSGTLDLKPRRFEGGGMRGVRLRDHLNTLHKVHKFTRVFYEEVRRHLGTDAAHIYGGLQMVLTAWCEENKVPYGTATVQDIKIHACKRGNAKKDEVIAAVRAWGYSPIDDNEADAIALLSLKLSELADTAA